MNRPANKSVDRLQNCMPQVHYIFFFASVSKIPRHLLEKKFGINYVLLLSPLKTIGGYFVEQRIKTPDDVVRTRSGLTAASAVSRLSSAAIKQQASIETNTIIKSKFLTTAMRYLLTINKVKVFDRLCKPRKSL